jgi:hypothetical protein
LLTLFPDDHIGIVVLTNAGNSTTDFFTQVVSGGIFDRLMGADLEPAIADEFNANVGYDPTVFHAAMDAARTFEPVLPMRRTLTASSNSRSARASGASRRPSRNRAAR